MVIKSILNKLFFRKSMKWEDFIEKHFFVKVNEEVGEKCITRLHPFKLNKQQKELADRIDSGDSIVVYYKHSRQKGITSLIAGFAVSNAIIKKKCTILIYCPNIVLAKQMFDLVKDFALSSKCGAILNVMRCFLPDIEFKNGSRILLRHNGNSVCGIRADYLLIDDAMFVDFDVKEKIYPVVQKDGKIICIE